MGTVEVVAGAVTFIAGIFTLVSIYRRMALRFLRFITWILIVTSMMQIVAGVMVYKGSIEEHWNYKLSVLITAGIARCLHQTGVLVIIWFLTFKYWETAN